MRAIRTTRPNPYEIARVVASTVPITEAQPFITQHQGKSAGELSETFCKPSGNGIPMKKPRGARMMTEATILPTVESDVRSGKIAPRPNMDKKEMTTTETKGSSRRGGLPFARLVNRLAKRLPNPEKTRKEKRTTVIE